MMEKILPLQKVKLMREDSALMHLREKQKQLVAASQVRLECENALENSASTLADREKAIFRKIIRKVVPEREVHTVRENVVRLHKDHTHLEEALESAIQHQAKLTQEVENASQTYHLALRAREKIDTTLQALLLEKAASDDQKEEAEIEDVFRNGWVIPA